MGRVLGRSARGFDKVSWAKQPRRELGRAEASERSRPRGARAGRPPPHMPCGWAKTSRPVQPLKHHDRVCFSAGKVSWCARPSESLRLLPCSEGGTTVWQRAPIAIQRSSIPIISTVAARSRFWMRRSIAPLTLPCMSPARPSGFGWTGAGDECPTAKNGARFAMPRRRGCYDQSRAPGSPSRCILGRSERHRGLSATH